MPNIAPSPKDHNNPKPSTKPIQLINQEDDTNKFFSKLVSKESSIANPSFRVYYGGVVGSVPFIWESQPGTPKHTLFDDNLSNLPPLTPPPSSFRSTTSTTNNTGKHLSKKARRPGLLPRLLRKIGVIRGPSPAVIGSSSSSLSGFLAVKPMDYRGRRSRFSSQGSFDSINPVDDYDDDEYEEGRIEEAKSVSCFGIGRRNKMGPRGCHGW